MVLLLALLLTACGGGAATSTPTSDPTAEPTVAPSDVPPTAEATEAADTVDDASEATEAAEGTAEAEATDDAGSAEAGSGEASAADAAAPVVRIEQDSTSLRAGPGVSYERVTTANSGDLLPALGRSGEGQTIWFQVEMPDGTIAWAWSRVATLLPEGAEIPEVEPPPSS
ncbi:MAG: SH3 domain-containing protein [Chloroflexi bacterium]|nr:SH3 domain-containing protein [Chloroflexota bacterium]